MPTIPPYIEKANVRGTKISYTWSKAKKEYDNPVPTMASFRLINNLSFNAALALALGIAEWIAWRLDGLSDDKSLFEFIEKGWETELKQEPRPKLEGYADRFDNKPEIGPLYHAQSTLSRILKNYEIKSTGIYQDVIYLKWLAEAVLPSKSAFDAWYKTTVERFNKKFQRAKYDKSANYDFYGKPVPREALDPNYKL